MYFAVIGNHSEIALKELQYVHPQEIKEIGSHLITFDTLEAEKLPLLASLIKWGKVVKNSELSLLFQGKKILGTADTSMGLNIKRKYQLKRFKKVDLLHTDREVKEKGIELITLPKLKDFVGVVQGYQNINFYEVVDFDKPARSMQTGMMPAKLTHTLITIGMTTLRKGCTEEILIFDPFCGTGTTGLIANHLGYHFIGSDIKLALALKNAQWWKTKALYKHTLLFQFLKQDISQPLSSDHFSALLTHTSLIITEGRLGPVIKQTTTPEQIKEYQRRVKNLYLQFLQTVSDFFPKDKKPPMVFTIPIYIGQENVIEHQIASLVSTLGWKMETIDEVYKREHQNVGRKIVILQ